MQLPGDGRGVLVVGAKHHGVSGFPDDLENNDDRGVDNRYGESREQCPGCLSGVSR
jgi:hypothetical protein